VLAAVTVFPSFNRQCADGAARTSTRSRPTGRRKRTSIAPKSTDIRSHVAPASGGMDPVTIGPEEHDVIATGTWHSPLTGTRDRRLRGPTVRMSVRTGRGPLVADVAACNTTAIRGAGITRWHPQGPMSSPSTRRPSRGPAPIGDLQESRRAHERGPLTTDWKAKAGSDAAR